MSCCRGTDKDPDLEFFDIIEKATFAITNRPTQSLYDDTTSNIRWAKYEKLKDMLNKIELITGKKIL